MEKESTRDISDLKEIIYILNNVDAKVIKNPLTLTYFEDKVAVTNDDDIIEIFDLGKITHCFVK